MVRTICPHFLLLNGSHTLMAMKPCLRWAPVKILNISEPQLSYQCNGFTTTCLMRLCSELSERHIVSNTGSDQEYLLHRGNYMYFILRESKYFGQYFSPFIRKSLPEVSMIYSNSRIWFTFLAFLIRCS